MDLPCLPYSQIPHTSRLFADYAGNSPKTREFYGPRFDLDSLIAHKVSDYPNDRRQAVAAVLRDQNQNWNCSAKTLSNVERLAAGAQAVVSGQQVTVFGGPLFSIYKALTAIRLAEELSKRGQESIPIFWLATEDHDFAEVSALTALTPEHQLKHFALNVPGRIDGAPVSRVRFGAEIEKFVDDFEATVGAGSVMKLLRQSYRPGETMGGAFAKLFTALFGDHGIVLLDASDARLHRIAQPVYRHAVEAAEALDQALLERGRKLDEAGYHQQVKVTSSSVLLFALEKGRRTPIRRQNGAFQIGSSKLQKGDLLRRVEGAPETFSPNVLLRPAVQDYLLPTTAYIGGPAEVAYFAQAAVVYQELLGRVTPIVPRFSATLVEPATRKLMERYRLSLADLFHGEEALQQKMAASQLPPTLTRSFSRAGEQLESSLAELKQELQRLDPTLTDAAERSASKMRYQLRRLHARATRAEARRTAELEQHARRLSACLYPDQKLQEREIAGISFVARYGPDFLMRLYAALDLRCTGHHLVSL